MHDLLSESFQKTSLEEMSEVKLMDRTDTKFVFNSKQLYNILSQAQNKYKVLVINDSVLLDYRTQYFDTTDLEMFTTHHNQKLNRFKIRQREYLISDICYCEVKFKSNKKRTIKKRFKMKKLETKLSEKSIKYINKKSNLISENLIPSVLNSFTRITLVHKEAQERITIDTNLAYENENASKSLPFLAIAEVKREGHSQSDFIDILKQNKIYPQGFSKYCIGVLMLYKNVKYNYFKEKLLTLKRIENYV